MITTTGLVAVAAVLSYSSKNNSRTIAFTAVIAAIGITIITVIGVTPGMIWSPRTTNNYQGNSSYRRARWVITYITVIRGMCFHLSGGSGLRWRHNGHDGVSNHQPHHCLLNRLFGCRSKKTSKLRVTCLCAGNSLGTGEFPAQMASNAENVSIWCHHHELNKGKHGDDHVWVP